jgi:hypothetical protein
MYAYIHVKGIWNGKDEKQDLMRKCENNRPPCFPLENEVVITHQTSRNLYMPLTN